MQYLAICEDDLLFQFMRNVAAEQTPGRQGAPRRSAQRRDVQKNQTAPRRSSHSLYPCPGNSGAGLPAFTRTGQGRVDRFADLGQQRQERLRRSVAAPPHAVGYLRRILRRATARHDEREKSRAYSFLVRRGQKDPYSSAA